MAFKKRIVTFDHDVLATPEQAAELLGTTPSCLKRWRSTGEHGIPYVKIGASVKYRVKDLRAYVKDGYESIKNFSFDDTNEFDVWQA